MTEYFQLHICQLTNQQSGSLSDSLCYRFNEVNLEQKGDDKKSLTGNVEQWWQQEVQLEAGGRVGHGSS